LIFSGKAASATLNIATADDTAASGATIDLTVGAFNAATNYTTVNIDATVGKFTATGTTLSVAANKEATLNVTGTKDVTLGTVVAKAVDASTSTGKVSLTSAVTKTITTGSADDVLIFTGAGVAYAVDAGNGANNLTITDAATAASFATGTGDDVIAVNTASAIVVVAGAGNDIVNVGAASDAIIVLGDGASDSIVFGGSYDLKAKENFSMTGVETVDITAGALTINSTAFSNDNAFKLVGDSVTADTLKVINTSTTAGATIDASGVTFAATPLASLILEGVDLFADTITGSAKDDVITGTTGADLIDGGAGTDTLNVAGMIGASIEGTGTGTAAGVVVNLSAAAITSTTILSGTGDFTAESITSVGSGATAYLFDATAATNSNVQQTLSSIETVIGSTGNDYIAASAAGNTITGGQGADAIALGAGADTIAFAAANEFAATDTVSNFTVGTDKIQIAGSLLGDANTTVTFSTAATIAAGGNAEVVVATTALANDAAIVTAIQTDTDTTASIFVVYNTADAETQVWYDDNPNVDGSEVQILTLTGVSDAAMDALATGDFVFV